MMKYILYISIREPKKKINTFPVCGDVFANHELRDNRELKQTTTATAVRTSPNKKLNEQNNSSARAFEVLVHFLAVLCKTTT